MKVSPPADPPLTGNAAKGETITTPYLYLEKIANENAFIIIDDENIIDGNPKYIDNNSTNADLPFHWQILQASPHRHIKVWADAGTPLIVKVVKLANDLDWQPVSAAPGGAQTLIKASANGTLPRIAINASKVYGIEYDDPTGPFPRSKADRNKVQVSTLTTENQGDDYVYVMMSGKDLVYFQKA